MKFKREKRVMASRATLKKPPSDTTCGPCYEGDHGRCRNYVAFPSCPCEDKTHGPRRTP